MKPRERVLQILNHQEADRIPVDLGGGIVTINADKYFELAKYLGLEDKASDAIVWKEWSVVYKPSEAMLERFGVDFRRVCMGEPRNFQPFIDKERDLFVGEWGLTWKRVGYYYEIVKSPLRDATIKEVLAYPFPDPSDPGRYEGLEEWAKQLYYGTDYCVVAGHPWPAVGVLELGCWLFGFEKFMTDIIIDKRLVIAFMDRYIEFQKELVGRYLDIVRPYVQIVDTADDLGTQLGPMISPKLYREMIKPYHMEYVQFIKSKVPHAKVSMHSCGSVFDLIPDLIEIGIDILNPIQPLAKKMEPSRLKKAYGDRLTFHGGIDVQDILPHRQLEEVDSYVRDTIRELASRGGYILGASHNIQPDVPPANIVAMYDAALKYGRYPIT